MYTFLVLGIIPGTDFQITFEMWLEIAKSLLLALFVVYAGSRMYRTVHLEAQDCILLRKELPASRLHQRAVLTPRTTVAPQVYTAVRLTPVVRQALAAAQNI